MANTLAAEQRKFTFELLVGDIVTRPVYAKNGNPLLDTNTLLNSEHISKLESWSVEQVWVRGNDEQETKAEFTVDDEAPFLNLGSLEAEEPISWEDLSKDTRPMAQTSEQIAARIDGFEIAPPVDRILRDPEPFVYDRNEITDAKKLVHEVQRKAISETKRVISEIAQRGDLNLDSLRNIIVNLVDNSISHRQVLGAITTLAQHEDYLLAHSVSSTVYALLVGHTMGLSREELLELAECTLLHDIGMSRISPSIWKKNGKINFQEQLEIQKHTIFGADVLHETSGISFVVELVAYQHHERLDGTGYPKGNAGRRIHEYAKIVSVVDAYSAMTSARPYRDKMLGYDAMKHILISSNTLFESSIVKAFLRAMALYPIGSRVELSNGMIGFVVSSNATAPYRPMIKVMRDENGRNTGGDGDVIDLMKIKDIGILRPLVDTAEDRMELWKAF